MRSIRSNVYLYLLFSVIPTLTLSFLVANNVFERINTDLERDVEIDDPVRNAEQARLWLKKYQHEQSLFTSTKLLKALKLFSDLLKTQRNCDWNSYSILLENNEKISKNLLHRPNVQVEGLSRVEKVVHKFSLRHASFCIGQKVYLGTLRLLVNLGIKVQLHRMRSFFRRVYESHLKIIKPDEVFNLRDYENYALVVSNISRFDDPVTLASFRQALLTLTKEDPDRTYLYKEGCFTNDILSLPFDPNRRSEKLHSLLGAYIFEPCNYFIELVKDVIQPAEYDMEMVGEMEGCGVDFINFQLARNHHKLCRKLLDKNLKAQIISGLRKFIDSEVCL